MNDGEEEAQRGYPQEREREKKYDGRRFAHATTVC